MPSQQPPVLGPAGSVVSADRTRIGYRHVGHGPGLVLIQGSFGTQQNFAELAQLLSDSFTVYLPDRRGRGMSPLPYDGTYTLQRDIDDLEALLDATGAELVFGLSSGAIIALWAAASSRRISKVVAFEPPLLTAERGVTAALSRFDDEIRRGDVAAAAVTAMLASQMGPRALMHIPRPVLELTAKLGLWAEKNFSHGPYATMQDLIPALRYDFTLIQEASINTDQLEAIACDVLLIGASRSPAYLRQGLDTVQKILPNAKRTQLTGVGHGAAWNSDRRGKPGTVAPILRRFLS